MEASLSAQPGSARSSHLRAGACAVILCAILPFLAGCATPKRLEAVPFALTTQASPLPGHTRFWLGADQQVLNDEAKANYDKEAAYLASTGHTGPLPPAYYLSISGGGDDGAFGAGLISGWTQAGNRPSF